MRLNHIASFRVGLVSRPIVCIQSDLYCLHSKVLIPPRKMIKIDEQIVTTNKGDQE
jgi:hypothetical protein